MRLINRKYWRIFPGVFGLVVVLVSCRTHREIIIKYSNPAITYSGRIDSSRESGADLYWSGTSIKIAFEGSSIEAHLEDEHGDNYYNVIVDELDPWLLRPDTIGKYYSLASKLLPGQ